MKLFIDDIRNAPDDKWAVARSVSEAIRFIAFFGLEIDEISIDHDISHQIGMGALSRPYPCPETFTAVAYFIAEFYANRRHIKVPKIVIHSSNVVGVETIQMILGKREIHSEIEMRGAANRLEMEVK